MKKKSESESIDTQKNGVDLVGLNREKVNKQKSKEILFKEQNGLCYYCGCKIYLQVEGALVVHPVATVDHKVPQSRGGSNVVDNKVMSCGKCNVEKGSLTTEEYIVVLAYRRMMIARFNGESFSCALCGEDEKK